MPPDSLAQALDAALDRLARGDDLAACLDQVPADAAALRPLLTLALALWELAADGDALPPPPPADAMDLAHVLRPARGRR